MEDDDCGAIQSGRLWGRILMIGHCVAGVAALAFQSHRLGGRGQLHPRIETSVLPVDSFISKDEGDEDSS